MKWSEAEARIRVQIIAGSTAILKCDGIGRRPVTSNTAVTIGMRTGVATQQTKAITYCMLRHAFEVLQTKGRFDSVDFRLEFEKEYIAGPCRYSMTGGILVEIEAATLRPRLPRLAFAPDSVPRGLE
jgi:hypothetical protein